MASATPTITKSDVVSLHRLLAKQREFLEGLSWGTYLGVGYTKEEFLARFPQLIRNHPLSQHYLQDYLYDLNQLATLKVIDKVLAQLSSDIQTLPDSTENQPETNTKEGATDAVTIAQKTKKETPVEPTALQKALANHREAADKMTKVIQEQQRLQALEEKLAETAQQNLKQYARGDTPQTKQFFESDSDASKRLHEKLKQDAHEAIINHPPENFEDITHRYVQQIQQDKTITSVLNTVDEKTIQQSFESLGKEDEVREVLAYVKKNPETGHSQYHQDLQDAVVTAREALKAELAAQYSSIENDGSGQIESLLNTLEDDIFTQRITNHHSATTYSQAVDHLFSTNASLNLTEETEIQLIEFSHLYQQSIESDAYFDQVSQSLSGYTPFQIPGLVGDQGLSVTDFRLLMSDYSPFYTQPFENYSPDTIPPDLLSMYQNYQRLQALFGQPVAPPVGFPTPTDMPPINPFSNLYNSVLTGNFPTGNFPNSLLPFRLPGIPSIPKVPLPIAGEAAAGATAAETAAVTTAATGTFLGLSAPVWGTIAAVIGGIFIIIFVIFMINGPMKTEEAYVYPTQGMGGQNDGNNTIAYCDPKTNPDTCPVTFCSGNCGCPVHGEITQGPGGSYSHKNANAIDIAVPNDNPVYSISAGTVKYAASDNIYGNHVIIANPDGTEVWYGHLDKYMVKVGDAVTLHQQIGLSDNSGHSSGPHLHLEYRSSNGQAIQNILNLFNFTEAQKAIINGCADNCGGIQCSF